MTCQSVELELYFCHRSYLLLKIKNTAGLLLVGHCYGSNKNRARAVISVGIVQSWQFVNRRASRLLLDYVLEEPQQIANCSFIVYMASILSLQLPGSVDRIAFRDGCH